MIDNGIQYDRLAATRGTDYLLVYNYTSRPMTIDLRKIYTPLFLTADRVCRATLSNTSRMPI